MKITSFDKVERSDGYIRARVTIKGIFRDTQRGVYAPRGSSLWYFFDDGQMAPSEVRQAYEAWVARDAFDNPKSEHIADAEKSAKELAANQAAAAAAFFGIYPGTYLQQQASTTPAQSRQSSSSGGDMLTGAVLGAAAGYAWSSSVSEPQSSSAPEVSSGGGGDFGGGGASGEY